MILYATIPSPAAIHQNALDHGWYDGVTRENMGPDFIPSKLALVHYELSEALEVYRKHGVFRCSRTHPCRPRQQESFRTAQE